MSARVIGIDTGGTFTDLVASSAAGVQVAKVPSTPDDPARAVVAALEQIGGAQPKDHIIHGTTVALNALLTGRTARVALVTGRGFADLLEIGRQERPDIYDLTPRKVAPLVPRELRFEVDARIWPDPSGEGFETIAKPKREDLTRLAQEIGAAQAESLAVCLLHSWADPAIEERVARALRSTRRPITCSATILPAHREFERFSTAVVNAALVPLMHSYLGGLEKRLAPARLSLLQSSGGTLDAARAASEPVRVLLSGPAGGVVGAARAATHNGYSSFVAFDMGGTSTDVAFHASGSEAEGGRAIEPVRVAGHPIGVPTLDIHTIGCGGGSLVEVDAAGVLHVGPKSAGADPGPVCYGKSDVPTVTDAHVLLGHIAGGSFLGGNLELDTDRVQRAFETFGKRLGIRALHAAQMVLDVARAAMRRAISVMTMQRGADPERLPLIAFGGAGGLHAAALAERLRMPLALVPRHPGALSAWGMTQAEPLRDHAATVLAPLASWPRKRRAGLLRELANRGREELRAAGQRSRPQAHYALDLRYRGQSFELTIPDEGDPAAAFHATHERLYGYRLEEREVELVTLRARVRIPQPPYEPRSVRARPLPKSAVRDERQAVFGARTRVPVVVRDELSAGHTFDGPALVEEYSGTTLVPPGWRARLTGEEHLVLEAHKGLRRRVRSARKA